MILLLLPSAIAAQFPRITNPDDATSFAEIATIETSVSPPSVLPGAVVTLRVAITLQNGCWTYPTAPPGRQTSRNVIVTPPGGPLIDVGPPRDPPGMLDKPGVQPGEIEHFYRDQVVWEWRAVVSPRAQPGRVVLPLTGSRFLACNSSSCFPARRADVPDLQFEVLAGPALEVPPEYRAAVEAALGPLPSPVPTPTPLPTPTAERATPARGLRLKEFKPVAEYEADLRSVLSNLQTAEGVSATDVGSGLLALLAAGLFWGFVSLITPCVFPMIPITVSLFLKQSHQSPTGAVKLALVYCVTIVLVLGLAAVFLLRVFRDLSVSPSMNVFLGLLLLFFALSLFGMYDITLPGFLLRATEKRRAAGGMIGTVFGALAFSIVSFTCVAPFLGGFAGLAASGNFSTLELMLGGLAFATAFAAPFFVLALFPSLLKKLPKSGGWLDTVKAVMGFLELAAAMKFFRTAEIRWPPVEYFTFDVVLASWVVIALVCGLYLLGVFRLPHDDEDKSQVGVMRLLVAIGFFGLGVYLLPGLFKGPDGKPQRPAGVVFAWVEAFLLPEPADDLPWGFDLKASLEEARRQRTITGQRKLVFVDFTGVNCTNCRYNEHHVFTLPNVNELLRQFVLVQLYTDDMPLEAYRSPPTADDRTHEADANARFQNDLSGTLQLPLYVIFEPMPDGRNLLLGIYKEGKINDKTAFAEFLAKALGN